MFVLGKRDISQNMNSNPKTTTGIGRAKKCGYYSIKMSGKHVEEEIKTLHKHFGGVVQMIRALKVSVEALENRLNGKETKEIKEILEAQGAIDEVLVANSNAIERIYKELQNITWTSGCPICFEQG